MALLTMRGLRLGACLAAMVAAAPARADDAITIEGSSTVFPFAAAVAEQFGARSTFQTPIVESTGSGGGLQRFCSGLGRGAPDIANSSRRMKRSEWELCQRNGVTEIVEVKIGFDGIVIANAKDAPDFDLSTRAVFDALADALPVDDACALAPNGNVTWADVSPAYPPIDIEVFGPPPTSGTRDAFVELALEAGARTYACLMTLRAEDDDAFIAVAHRVREDGAFIDAGENDNAIVSTLVNTPTALGVFGFSFLDQNSDQIKGAAIDGVAPTFENIASGAYPVSRSLYFYVKKQNVETTPGLREFAMEFTSEGAWGLDGYLVEKGLIPLSEDQRADIAARVEAMEIMTEADASELN